MFGRAPRFPAARGYRRLLVPLDDRRESFEALDIACRLAADDDASITVLSILEIPALLPIDTHLEDAEDAAHRLLERAGATGDAYGVHVVQELVRARDGGDAILVQAAQDRSELIVMGGVAATALRHVVSRARCRVMIVSASRA